MTMPTLHRLSRATVALAALTTLLMVSGCGRGEPESAIINEDVPVIDIAQLPDIEQTTTQMLDLIERVRAEVTRLVPASAPWEWNRDQTGTSCVQEKTGRKGVSRYLRNLVSKHSFSDAEWELVFPAVRQLATEAGLTDIAAPQNQPGNHDMRFSSDDGRTLMFGSRVASVITGKIVCRQPAGAGP
jgi:hypothetical protein